MRRLLVNLLPAHLVARYGVLAAVSWRFGGRGVAVWGFAWGVAG